MPDDEQRAAGGVSADAVIQGLLDQIAALSLELAKMRAALAQSRQGEGQA